MIKKISIFICFSMLVACHPSPETIKRVNEITFIKKDKTTTCPISDKRHCAVDTPLELLYDSSLVDNKDRVTLLEKGEESLLIRLHLIKSAQTSIDIQTFIWVNDESGHLMIAELLQAAKRGVRVNIIIDQLFSMGNTWLLAELATLHENLNIRLFNPLFNEADTSKFDFFSAITCCLYNLNRRMHNKLFLVDDKYGINGGRNYSDRYFDWDSTFNYRDRDALVVGAVAKQMKQSFNEFWYSQWIVPLENLDDVALRILNNQETTSEWAVARQPKTALLSLKAYEYNYIKNKFVDTAIAVDDVEYFSDSPAKLFTKNKDSDDKYIQMVLKIKELIVSADDSLLLQTPYLVLSKKAYRALRILRKHKPHVKIEVSTNSLSSTDAFYVYAISYKHKKKYLKKLNLTIHEYKNNPQNKSKMFPSQATNEEVIYGMHAKSFVIDNYISMIGSHNFDPRSDVLNTESGLIIKSKKLALKLSEYINDDMKPENAWIIAPNKKIPFLSFFSGMIASVSRSLPILDVWPFRYSSSFELRPGKPEVDVGHPDFYENYKNVGNFPDVDLPLKQIQTIIISAFAGFAEPVM